MGSHRSELPQGHNRQTIYLPQRWVKSGFFVICWKWPKSGSSVGPKLVSGAFSSQNRPKPTSDPLPLLGHFQRMTKNPLLTRFPKNLLRRCLPCRVGHGKTAEKQPEEQTKQSQNSCFHYFWGVSAVLPALFRLSYRDPRGALFGNFRLFSMSGFWHLCRCLQRLQ